MEFWSQSDLKAFDALVVGTKREFLEQNVRDDYLKSATTLGVIIDESDLI